jgi:hypothetical protein
MRLAGDVACMGRIYMHKEFWWGSLRERDCWDDLTIGGRII